MTNVREIKRLELAERKTQAKIAYDPRMLPDDVWSLVIMRYISTHKDLVLLWTTSKVTQAIIRKYLNKHSRLNAAFFSVIGKGNTLPRISILSNKINTQEEKIKTAFHRKAEAEKSKCHSYLNSTLPVLMLGSFAGGIVRGVQSGEMKTALQKRINSEFITTCNNTSWWDDSSQDEIFGHCKAWIAQVCTNLNVTLFNCSTSICDDICGGYSKARHANDEAMYIAMLLPILMLFILVPVIISLINWRRDTKIFASARFDVLFDASDVECINSFVNENVGSYTFNRVKEILLKNLSDFGRDRSYVITELPKFAKIESKRQAQIALNVADEETQVEEITPALRPG